MLFACKLGLHPSPINYVYDLDLCINLNLGYNLNLNLHVVSRINFIYLCKNFQFIRRCWRKGIGELIPSIDTGTNTINDRDRNRKRRVDVSVLYYWENEMGVSKRLSCL